MNTITAFLKRHSFSMGILMMFAFTWPIALADADLLPFRVPFIIGLFVGWGIIFATLLMTGLTQGRMGVTALLKRYLLWRVGWKWYLAALFLSPFLMFGGVYLYAALTGIAPDYDMVMIYQVFGRNASWLLLVGVWLIYEILTNGEEIGWRGYVLPRLQAQHSALTSSLILGVIWGLWHLPRFLTDFDPVRFGWFMVHILAQTIIYTWLFNNTRGSLLLVTLYHACANTAGMFAPIANTVTGGNMGAY